MLAWAAILALTNALALSAVAPEVKTASPCSLWVAAWKSGDPADLLSSHSAEPCWNQIPERQLQEAVQKLNEETRLTLSEDALDQGHPGIAAVTVPASAGSPAFRQRLEILQARLAACRGHWQETDARLEAWKIDPERSEGSGAILFWQGWSALHQGHRGQADSLFILASAYVEENRSQSALEYRYAMLVDRGQGLLDFIHGLPESPWPDSGRLLSLQSLTAASPLYPEGRWQLALLLEKSGKRPAAIAVLEDLEKQSSALPGRRAAALLAFLKEEHPDSAIAAYERLLLEYQQGVPAEFARNRMKTLKGQAAP
jgi:hypothetical protein